MAQPWEFPCSLNTWWVGGDIRLNEQMNQCDCLDVWTFGLLDWKIQYTNAIKIIKNKIKICGNTIMLQYVESSSMYEVMEGFASPEENGIKGKKEVCRLVPFSVRLRAR